MGRNMYVCNFRSISRSVAGTTGTKRSQQCTESPSAFSNRFLQPFVSLHLRFSPEADVQPLLSRLEASLSTFETFIGEESTCRAHVAAVPPRSHAPKKRKRSRKASRKGKKSRSRSRSRKAAKKGGKRRKSRSRSKSKKPAKKAKKGGKRRRRSRSQRRKK
ncbi:hypothetical protein Bbelb_438670 [Branchiostoma belcheri]|nr:hypothetical protein Bbelb_438670 [Branchiostoma belcheri]